MDLAYKKAMLYTNIAKKREYFPKFANFLTIIGALLVANSMFLHGYLFFFGGALCWMLIGMNRNDKDIVLLNCIFIVVNIYGFINLGIQNG